MSKQKDSFRMIAILRAQTHGANFTPSIFAGQDYIPHKARNNRKTKKGSK